MPVCFVSVCYIFLIKISTPNFLGIFLRLKNIIPDIRNDPVLLVSSQESPMSLKSTPLMTPFPYTYIIKISSLNFQGIFLRVNKLHSWHQKQHVSTSIIFYESLVTFANLSQPKSTLIDLIFQFQSTSFDLSQLQSTPMDLA